MTALGLVKSGDPRSELVVSIFEEGIGLPMLLNGLSTKAENDWRDTPSVSRITTISPLAQLRQGKYKVPTYIVHSTNDEIVPVAGADRFISMLREQGVKHGFLKLHGSQHLHDLKLRPGMNEWEEQVAPGYRFLFEMVKAG